MSFLAERLLSPADLGMLQIETKFVLATRCIYTSENAYLQETPVNFDSFQGPHQHLCEWTAGVIFG